MQVPRDIGGLRLPFRQDLRAERVPNPDGSLEAVGIQPGSRDPGVLREHSDRADAM